MKKSQAPTDKDVLDNISDDIIYLGEIIKREKRLGLDVLKASFLGRITAITVSNAIEAHRDFICRKMGLTKKVISWEKFFNNKEICIKLNEICAGTKDTFQSLSEFKDGIYGLKAMRDIISHGLTYSSANNYEKKRIDIESFKLTLNPSRLNETDIDHILNFDAKATQLFFYFSIDNDIKHSILIGKKENQES